MSWKKVLDIAVAPGDGIGPEIMNACIKIFNATKVPMNYNFVEMGKSIYLSGYGNGMTPKAQNTVEELGILYKGPMETPKGTGMKSINVTARKVWNAYANKRVFRTFPGIDTVFSRAGIPIDLTLIRENTEDTYGAIEHMQSHDVAQCRRLITRPGSFQVHKYAFEYAKTIKTKRITCCHKANIMKLTDGLFLETFYQTAKNNPDLKADDIIVDDLAMKLVAIPDTFGVIVLPNLQGDIISDLAAGLVGGLGMAPSANIGDQISIFEAVHGTAPDIAGKGIANPTALLLSGIMMLRHLNFNEHANYIEKALFKSLSEGARTRDLIRRDEHILALTTDQYADVIISNLPAEAKEVSTNIPWEKPARITLPPQKPSEHVMHQSPRNKAEESVVGMDIFLDSDLQPKELVELIQSRVDPNLTIIMLSNRGTQVWPSASLFTECVNHYRCRVESKDLAAQKPSDLISTLKNISNLGEDNGKFRIASVEMLLKIGEKRAYSLAQGQ